MALSVAQRALVAFQRFGYGAKPAGLTDIADARGALHAEIAQADAALITSDTVSLLGLNGTADNHQNVFRAAEARRDMQAALMSSAEAQAFPAGRSEVAAEATQARIAGLHETGMAAERIFRAEALARFRKAADAKIGFAERLVAFWSNHFCISVAKGELARATAGSFEREAIRPFVLGRFADMLLAVERHPAMLFYLDNVQSVGPDARANANHKRGLNENLAREILELHTLGVGSGYSQGDVTAFARVLTGWGYAGHDGRLGEPGTFVFNANLHEPGNAVLIGKTYVQGGFGQGEAALDDFARHPATARHIATKLVRHFIADDPPKAAIDRIAAVFTASDGDLRAVSLALVDLPQAWTLPLTNLRNPDQFLIAAHRLLSLPLADPGLVIGGLRTLGMPLWEPPGPNGFPDGAEAWISPEGLKLRLDLSAQLAQRVHSLDAPLSLIDQAFGETASQDTRMTVSRAESREQAIALILMSPEFQRR